LRVTWSDRVALIALAGTMLVGTAGPAAAAPAAPAPAPAAGGCAGQRPDTRTAAATAAACHRPVEDMSRRTASSATVLGPDGTSTVTSYAQPRWVRRAGGWSDVDTALRPTGRSLAPAATALPMAFSAGGSGPLATLADGARELAMSWPAALPAPTVAGDSATYAGVLPGVDLRVTARVDGFTEVLIARTPAALRNPVLASVHFGLRGTGLTVAPDGAGGAVAADAAGAATFTTPAPRMWDSAPLPRTAVMGLAVDGTGLTLTPDPKMLADTTLTFPVFLDPSWTGGAISPGYKVVASRSDVAGSSTFSLVNGANQGQAGAGRTCDSSSGGTCTSTQYVVRTFFPMNIDGARGKHVLRASFSITQKWSWTCSPGSNAGLWLTGGIGGGTSWNNQPGWDGNWVAQTAANHRVTSGGGCPGAGGVSFDLSGLTSLALQSGWPNLTVGLRALDEGTINQWKRFDTGTAALSIQYNSYPNVPDTLTSAGQACATGDARPIVAVPAPVLSARLSDPDGGGEGDINGSLTGDFGWERWDAPTATWIAAGSGSGGPQAGGLASPVPAPALTTGIYRWHARALDSWTIPGVASGTDPSGFSGWCEFEVDVTPPATAVLTPDPANGPAVAGRTVRLTFSRGSAADTDVTGYSWFVVDGAETHPAGFVTGATATVDWTPIAGQATVHVRAKDRVQTSVAEATYAFTARQAATEVARWPLAEPAGATGIADSTGNGHAASAALAGPATLGAPGRIVSGATALSLDGGAGSTVGIGGPLLDASRSLTVAAWVRLADRTTGHVAASQLGSGGGGVSLEYTAGTDRWELVTSGATGAVTGRAVSTVVPAVGVWTQLAGTYDSATKTARLYVGGRPQGSAAGVVDGAAGPLRIGTGHGAPFAGSLSDVRVWDRMLSDAEVAELADPTGLANAGTDNVGRWLVEPETCFGDPTICADTSRYAHDIALTGDVAVTDDGQVGSGLTYAGQNGVASSTDPATGAPGAVLHTDQSFTVSVWARPTTIAVDQTFVAQQSTGSRAGFSLGFSSSSAGVWRFRMHASPTDTTTGAVAIAPATGVTTAFHHLVGVFDAQKAELRLYVDGVLKATTPLVAPWQPWDATGPVLIGRHHDATTGTEFTAGSLDEVRVYQGVVADVTRIL
jgi:Concanavalin A-like lectin/glucanases superfamily